MSETNTAYTLPKKERLCSKKLLDQLFLKQAFSKKVWPVKAKYQVVDKASVDDAPVLMLVSVSKRHFKRAVKRNRVKRQLREAYRLHKQQLVELVDGKYPTKRLLVAFIWMEPKLHESSVVEAAMTALLDKMSDSLSGLQHEVD